MRAKNTSGRLGFGGGGVANIYSNISDAQAQATLQAAFAGGITAFDTAPLYGHGLSELRVGQFLRSIPRESFSLSTKVGRYLTLPRDKPVDPGIWVPPLNLRPVFDYTYEGAMRSLEQSVSRLGIDHIDVVYIHDLDRRNHGPAFERTFGIAMEGTYRALDELRKAGDVGEIGVGVNEADVACDFLRAGNFGQILIAGRYSLLDQSAGDELFPLAASQAVRVVVAGVFNSGILATGAGRKAGPTHYDYAEPPAEMIAKTRKLAEISKRHGVMLQAAAIRFCLDHPAATSILIGMNSPDRVRQNLEWLGAEIPDAFWHELRDANLIQADAMMAD